MNANNLFTVKEIKYEKRCRNLQVKGAGVVNGTKFFPVFITAGGKEEIFKPLSRTKPLCTTLFAYSEVYCSYIINKYFDAKAPVYQLATCKGISKEQIKYYEKGTLVESFLKTGQRFVNLLEYFKKEPDSKVDINNYINFCEMIYNYESIFNSDIFSLREDLSEQLSTQILFSILTRNQNFHYENIGFIYEGGEIISLAPSIDHEFSSMFLYIDCKEMHDKMNARYDDLLDVHSKSILTENIRLIVKRHPELCKRFAQKLKKLRADLEDERIAIEDEDYIGTISSYEWMIGDTRIKKNNEELANRLEKSIIKVGVDTNQLSNDLTKEFIHSSKMLENVIDYFILII